MRQSLSIFTLLLVIFARAAGSFAQTASPDPLAAAFFKSHVEPILWDNCVKCHGGIKQKASLDLRAPETILRGGESGPVVIPGKPDKSMLIRVLQTGADTHMPPDNNKQLTIEQAELIKTWIEKLSPATQPPTTRPAKGSWVSAVASGATTRPISSFKAPAGLSPAQMIDQLVAEGWKVRNVVPAATCDDATFIRRLSLDLIGRIPTPAELDAFLKSTTTAKRSELAEKLLASPEYSNHMAEMFDTLLLGRPTERTGKRAAPRRSDQWTQYLERSFASNRPWNQIVRDLVLARPTSPEQQGSQWFLFERKNDHQKIAEAVAPLIYGVRIDCAQCHNHPLVHEIEQRHYWGLVAAFNRSTNVDAPAAAVGESAIGGFVSFTNLMKETQPALLSLYTGQTLSEDRPAVGAKETDSPDKYQPVPAGSGKNPANAPPVPKNSRRQLLADSTTANNPLLTRASVNRMWAMLIGRGIVHPMDQIDSRHPASHPDLLQFLADDFEKSGYDTRRLIRNITTSRAYQLDACPASAAPLPADAFAAAIEKPLPAESLYRSILIATGHWPEKDTSALKRTLIERFPDVMPAEYNPSLQQAMFLTNNAAFNALLQPRDGNTAARLLAIPDPAERVKEAFRLTLGRQPAAEELQQSLSFLNARTDRPAVAVGQLLWSLISSAEFLLNH